MTLPSFVASSTVDMGAGGNGTSVVLTRPAAWTSGLIALVPIYKESSAAITPPSGWTELATISPTANGTRFWSHIFWKALGGSEPSSYTWSWTGSVWREGGGLAIQDADPTTPIHKAAVTVTTSSTTTITCPAVTPTVANTLLVCFGLSFTDSIAYTSNDGMTERIDVGGIPGRAYTAATETGPASGVASGSNTFTATSAAENTGFTLAIQEVQSAGSITGTGGITIAKPSLGTSATETFAGAGALTIAAPSLAAASSEVFAATGAVTIGHPALAASALELFAASGGIVIAVPSLSAAGLETFLGAGAVTIGHPVLDGLATLGDVINASGGIVIGHPSLSAAALESLAANGGLTISPPSLAGAALVSFAASGGVIIGPPALAGAGTVLIAITGAGGIVIGPPSISASEVLLLPHYPLSAVLLQSGESQILLLSTGQSNALLDSSGQSSAEV